MFQGGNVGSPVFGCESLQVMKGECFIWGTVLRGHFFWEPGFWTCLIHIYIYTSYIYIYLYLYIYIYIYLSSFSLVVCFPEPQELEVSGKTLRTALSGRGGSHFAGSEPPGEKKARLGVKHPNASLNHQSEEAGLRTV